ncbi:hypothetical protein HWV62_34543 [Athelia sp. TMB]|nr:hypothetical protein HWV62_34543 [Athelia sp. TMB]
MDILGSLWRGGDQDSPECDGGYEELVKAMNLLQTREGQVETIKFEGQAPPKTIAILTQYHVAIGLVTGPRITNATAKTRDMELAYNNYDVGYTGCILAEHAFIGVGTEEVLAYYNSHTYARARSVNLRPARLSPRTLPTASRSSLENPSFAV